MHSKSDNLGYLKDKKRDIFRGLHPLDPHQGSALDPLQGGLRACPQTRSPMMLASHASFAITYLFFFRTHASHVLRVESPNTEELKN